MSHEIDFSNNRANMAYVGKKPWHGLGEELEEGLSIDEWRIAAGLDWTLETSPATFEVGDTIHTFENKNIVYRSDTKAPLGIVSGNRYNIVQPGEILEFYIDLVDTNQFSLETAGSLKGGKVIWALAKTFDSFTIGKTDTVESYLLLTTGTDGKKSTVAQYVSVRVVCNNTLELALDTHAGQGINVRHCSDFDSVKVKSQLGLNNVQFVEFSERVKELSKYKLKDKEVMDFIIRTVNGVDEVDTENLTQIRKIDNIYSLYKGKGLGSTLEGSNGTLWGAVNAVTEFVDHKAGRNTDNRISSAWLGGGRNIKNRALTNALKFVA